MTKTEKAEIRIAISALIWAASLLYAFALVVVYGFQLYEPAVVTEGEYAVEILYHVLAAGVAVAVQLFGLWLWTGGEKEYAWKRMAELVTSIAPGATVILLVLSGPDTVPADLVERGVAAQYVKWWWVTISIHSVGILIDVAGAVIVPRARSKRRKEQQKKGPSNDNSS